MPYELNEIKIIRKKFGLTQTELAKKAGVSQSLIAKIESNLIDPTFSKARKIFATLDNLHEKHELKAKDIMHKKIICANPAETIHGAIKKMQRFGISQIPVISNQKSIGIISEAILLDALVNGKKNQAVKEVMKDSAPVISKDSSIQVISGLLRFFPMVLVSEKGKLIGVITKSDLLDKMYGK